MKIEDTIQRKSTGAKKHGKHFCKKCQISFATSRVLTSHIKKFHKFDTAESDHKESDSDINVIYNADDKPSCVKAFKEEINENICHRVSLDVCVGVG